MSSFDLQMHLANIIVRKYVFISIVKYVLTIIIVVFSSTRRYQSYVTLNKKLSVASCKLQANKDR